MTTDRPISAGPGRVLILAAAPAEARAIADAAGVSAPAQDNQSVQLTHLPHEIELVRTGVGKVNAALGVAGHIDPDRHQIVLALGLAGALPTWPATPNRREFSADVLDVVIATRCVYADEGVCTLEGFVDIAACGFPPGRVAEDQLRFEGVGVNVPPEWVERAARAVAANRPDIPVRRGMVGTVSTCSGTDALAAEVVRRTGAIAETMESAAIGHALSRLSPGVTFMDVRVISNLTGDRSRQAWQLDAALIRLGDVAGVLIREVLSRPATA